MNEQTTMSENEIGPTYLDKLENERILNTRSLLASLKEYNQVVKDSGEQSSIARSIKPIVNQYRDALNTIRNRIETEEKLNSDEQAVADWFETQGVNPAEVTGSKSWHDATEYKKIELGSVVGSDAYRKRKTLENMAIILDEAKTQKDDEPTQ